MQSYFGHIYLPKSNKIQSDPQTVENFFEERYERRRADFTTEEINEKITMVKMEIRKKSYILPSVLME